MLLDDNHDARMEKWKETVKSDIEPLLRPSLDRLQEITKYWAIKHWWTAEECAALFVGANPDLAQHLAKPNFPLYLAPGVKEKFDRVLDLVHRRFGNRVDPAEACRWAALIGMKQEYLEQALVSIGAVNLRMRDQASQIKPRVRREDITKLPASRPQPGGALGAH